MLLVSGDTQTNENVYDVVGGAVVPKPVSLGSGSDQAYLLFYGTGLRAAATQGVTVTIGGVPAQVQYAGTQGGFAGLDQINVLVPPSLAGKGAVMIQVTANGVAANPVNISIQ